MNIVVQNLDKCCIQQLEREFHLEHTQSDQIPKEWSMFAKTLTLQRLRQKLLEAKEIK